MLIIKKSFEKFLNNILKLNEKPLKLYIFFLKFCSLKSIKICMKLFETLVAFIISAILGPV